MQLEVLKSRPRGTHLHQHLDGFPGDWCELASHGMAGTLQAHLALSFLCSLSSSLPLTQGEADRESRELSQERQCSSPPKGLLTFPTGTSSLKGTELRITADIQAETRWTSQDETLH